MTCDRARELFSEYLEGISDEALAATVGEHISHCPSCSRDFDLFRKTWQMFGSLPEIELPASLRHDIVMNAARLQHERTRETGRISWNLADIFSFRQLPARAIAVTFAVAALLLVLYRLPESAFQSFTGAFDPSIRIVEPKAAERTADTIHTSPLSKLESGRKREWQARKLRRNTIWVTIEPTENSDGTALYKVMLAINENALLPNEATVRIGAKVFLMPPDKYCTDAGSGTTVWEGNILANSPVIVPVIVDSSQGRAGTVNLLVNWRFRKRDFAQVIFLPTKKSSAGSESMFNLSSSSAGFGDQTDTYSMLRRISRDYCVPVVVRSGLEIRMSVSDFAGATLDEALRCSLKPVGLDWLCADDAVYVDVKVEPCVSD